MAQALRIFISSPGDVEDERRRAAIVVGRLAREFARFFEIKPVLWEYEPMLASGHFQDIIEPPSRSDIEVVILWSRLGTPLPAERYRGIDGRAPVTGTEWEFEDALKAHRERGAPDLLVYRKRTKGIAEFDSTEELEAAALQRKALEQFWERYFGSAQSGFKAAFNLFTDRDEFEQMLESHLRALIRERLPRLAGGHRRLSRAGLGGSLPRAGQRPVYPVERAGQRLRSGVDSRLGGHGPTCTCGVNCPPAVAVSMLWAPSISTRTG